MDDNSLRNLEAFRELANRNSGYSKIMQEVLLCFEEIVSIGFDSGIDIYSNADRILIKEDSGFMITLKALDWIGINITLFLEDGSCESEYYFSLRQSRKSPEKLDDSESLISSFYNHLLGLAFEQQNLVSGIESFLEGRSEQGK